MWLQLLLVVLQTCYQMCVRLLDLCNYKKNLTVILWVLLAKACPSDVNVQQYLDITDRLYLRAILFSVSIYFHLFSILFSVSFRVFLMRLYTIFIFVFLFFSSLIFFFAGVFLDVRLYLDILGRFYLRAIFLYLLKQQLC